MQSFDVDIDFKNRNEILALIDHTPAILVDRTKHATGIYATAIPQNPITGYASLDYKKAEELGYFKFDFLNQSVYKQVKSPEHLEKLLTKEFVITYRNNVKLKYHERRFPNVCQN